MSLGVAGTFDWHDLGGEQLIHEADIALYRAKETGRNRAVLALPSGPEDCAPEDHNQAPIPAA